MKKNISISLMTFWWNFLKKYNFLLINDFDFFVKKNCDINVYLYHFGGIFKKYFYNKKYFF